VAPEAEVDAEVDLGEGAPADSAIKPVPPVQHATFGDHSADSLLADSPTQGGLPGTAARLGNER
jgi:hypothetical protein